MNFKLSQKLTSSALIFLFSMLVGNTALSQNLDLTEFKNSVLSAHNTLRSLHQETSSIVLDDELSRQAQNWAEHLLSIDRLESSSDIGEVGENFYFTTESNKPRPSEEYLDFLRLQGYTEARLNKMFPKPLTGASLAASAVLKWYKEFYNYHYSTHKGTNGDSVGHFTQLVWRDTTKMGCGFASGPAKSPDHIKVYVVCRYSPSGNIQGEYRAQVMPRKPGTVTPTLLQITGEEE